jgi:glycerol-3-phosphate acyltransferase PlsY
MNSYHIAIFFTVILFAYLAGSIPFGLILTRAFTSRDLRREGSGNIGATNARRVGGTMAGILTLAGDVLKGAIPAYMATVYFQIGHPEQDYFCGLVALASFSGHLYPVFLKFRDGGKGVATAAGCFLVLAPVATLVAFLSFISAAFISNHVSSASIVAFAVLPFAIFLTVPSKIFFIFAILISLAGILRHRDNIKRLREGIEPVIWQRTK